MNIANELKFVRNPEREGELNRLLKAHRTNRKMAQEELAALAGVTVRAYQYYETGEKNPSAATAIRIAEALHIKSFTEFKKLFGGATPTTPE